MPVTQETPIASSIANGVTTVFPYAFTVLQQGDLVVQGTLNGIVTTYTVGVDFTISGLGTPSGSVNFVAPPANGTEVLRYRDTTIDRSTDYQENGDLYAEVLDRDLDRIIYMLQEIFNGGKGVPNAVRVPNGETIPALPPRDSRKNMLIATDSNGDPTVLVPTSGTAADVLIQLANSADLTKGDALFAIKRLLAGSIATTGHLWHEAQVIDATAEWGMASGGSAAANTAALQLAISAAVTLGRGQVEIQAGTYALTAGTNFAASNVAIVGRGQVIFDFSAGAGVGFKIDGVAAYIQGMRIENILFRGGPSITEVFQSRRVIRSMFRNLEAREGTTIGFGLRHAVLNTYDHCIVSDDVGSMTTRPNTYWLLTDDGTVDNHTQANLFLNCEASGHGAGSTKTGWTLTNAILNVWQGGTSESVQIGVDITSDVCRMNSWYGFDMEDNQQYDARLKGLSNNFYSSFAQSAGGGIVDNVSISTGVNCGFFGGYYRKVNLGAGSSDTAFMGVTFDDNGANGIQGTGSFKRYDCITNTGGVGGAKTGTLRDVLGPSAATTLSMSQGNTPAQTVSLNEATVTGRMVQMRGRITATAAGTAANSIAVTLDPSFPAKATAVGLPAGTFMLVLSGGTIHVGVAVLNTAGVLVFRVNAATGNLGVNPAVTLANGDVLSFVAEYPLE